MSVLLAETSQRVRNQPVIEALREAIVTGRCDDTVEQVVAALRTSDYNISEFLADCGVVKKEVRDKNPASALRLWGAIDYIIAAAVQITSCVHEMVLETCTRGYAILDSVGRVVYANSALLAFAPDLVGRPLQELFPTNGEIIRGALAASERCGPFRLEMHTVDGVIPATADFGPIQFGNDAVGRYALIGDIRAYIEAQTASFEACPFGIMRVDRQHRIQFVNRVGRHMLQPHDALERLEVEELFAGAEREQLESAVNATLEAGDGFVRELNVLHPGGTAIPMRLFAVPEHDPQRRRTGALIFFRSLQIERARDQIYRACERFSTPEAMLKELFAILHDIVPFDRVSFGMYAENMSYFRTLFAEPQSIAKETAPWLAIPPEISSWMKGDKTWEEDVDAFFDRYPSASELFRNPLVQAFRAEGYRSFISFPVRQQNGISTVLSLASKTRGQYGEEDYSRLRELPVEQALRMAQEGFLQRRRDIVHETLKQFANASSHGDLARIVIGQFSKAFAWDHVSIFKVNQVDQRFELLDQVDRTNGSFTFVPGYTQPIDAGMLGKALSSGAPVWLDDTSASPLPQPYVSVCGGARSALCIPIRLDETVNWILNVETGTINAFHGPDLEAVQSVLYELSRALEKSFQSQLTQDVLNLTDQGVVIIDAQGRIRDANVAAQQLLGGSRSDLKGLRFVDFAIEEDREIFSEARPCIERHVQIRDLKGELRPAIVSLRRPIEEYDHKIWLLTDTIQRDWNVELRYLRETVHDVAQQTRVPLMAAGNLVKRVTGLVDKPDVREQVGEFVDKAVQLLGKAHITYERLVEGLTERRGDLDARTFVNLSDCIKDVVSELPISDQKEIIIKAPVVVGPVWANRNAIDFVFRSVIFYLLRKKPIRQKVKIKISSSKSDVKVRISARGLDGHCASRPHDSITIYEREARLEAALAPAALESVVALHGGHIQIPTCEEGTANFEISLPIDQIGEVSP